MTAAAGAWPPDNWWGVSVGPQCAGGVFLGGEPRPDGCGPDAYFPPPEAGWAAARKSARCPIQVPAGAALAGVAARW
jgi:hypothetical protein